MGACAPCGHGWHRVCVDTACDCVHRAYPYVGVTCVCTQRDAQRFVQAFAYGRHASGLPPLLVEFPFEEGEGFIIMKPENDAEIGIHAHDEQRKALEVCFHCPQESHAIIRLADSQDLPRTVCVDHWEELYDASSWEIWGHPGSKETFLRYFAAHGWATQNNPTGVRHPAIPSDEEWARLHPEPTPIPILDRGQVMQDLREMLARREVHGN